MSEREEVKNMTDSAAWVRWIERVNAHMARTGESAEDAATCIGAMPRRINAHKRIRGILTPRTRAHAHGPTRVRTVSQQRLRAIVRARRNAHGITVGRTIAQYINARPCNTHTHAA
jgi:hypothetical protein